MPSERDGGRNEGKIHPGARRKRRRRGLEEDTEARKQISWLTGS